jgi:acyl carrier protein
MEVLFSCVDEINKQLPPDEKLKKEVDTKLAAEGGHLDSLGLITLLVEMEESLKNSLDIDCSLVDELTQEHEESPFLTIGTLAKWVSERPSKVPDKA